MPGFGPAAEVLFFREKDPKPLMPHPASLDELDANSWRAGQLAWLKQGPPFHQSVHSWAGQQASVGIQEINIIGFGPAARLHPRRDNSRRKIKTLM